MILNGAFSDVTNGATFFHASEVSPSWSKKFKKTRKIGRHIFYKNQQYVLLTYKDYPLFSEEFKKKDLLDLGGKKKANVDHILVSDYVREIDIGAFQPEYGVKQRVSFNVCLLYTSPSPRDGTKSRMPSSA